MSLVEVAQKGKNKEMEREIEKENKRWEIFRTVTASIVEGHYYGC